MARGKIDAQLKALDEMKFDSTALRKAISDFRADIEADEEFSYLREKNKVATGQKSRTEVENEIDSRVAKIKALFDRTLDKTNKTLEDIKTVHDRQLLTIFEFLKAAVLNLKSLEFSSKANTSLRIASFGK